MNLPSQITLLRILLVPVFIGLLIYSSGTPHFYHAAVAVFLVSCLTDALDGYLARRLGQTSTFGRIIDPLADKILLLSGFLCLSLMENLPPGVHIPGWVTIAVIARDAVILIGAIVIYLVRGKIDPEPMLIGKITTFVQMATIVLVLFRVPEPIKVLLFYGTFILTFSSGVIYINHGSREFQA